MFNGHLCNYLQKDELAEAGQFPHSRISFAKDFELILAGAALGYTIVFLDTPGRGFHHDLSIVGIQKMPTELATALSVVWQQRQKPNPIG